VAPTTYPQPGTAERPRTQGGGQATVEFALVLVVFIVIIMGIVDLARAVHARNLVVSAAREGARYGTLHPGDTTGIEAAAKALVYGMSAGDIVVTTTRPDAAHVQVEVSYTFHPISSLIAQYVDGGSGAGITLRGRSLMRTE